MYTMTKDHLQCIQYKQSTYHVYNNESPHTMYKITNKPLTMYTMTKTLAIGYRRRNTPSLIL